MKAQLASQLHAGNDYFLRVLNADNASLQEALRILGPAITLHKISETMKIYRILMLAAVGAPLPLAAQQSYTIKGTVGKLNPAGKAYLAYKVNGERILDSAEIKNGQFRFSGKVVGTREAHIRLAKHNNEEHNPVTRPKEDVLAFFLEDKVITISAKDSIHNAVIKRVAGAGR